MAKDKKDKHTIDWVLPERIWLIDVGGGDVVWSDSPDPSPDIDPADVRGPYILQQEGGNHGR